MLSWCPQANTPNDASNKPGEEWSNKPSTTTGEELIGFSELIWAVGRTPNTADLNLEATGVQMDKRGFIPTDEYQNTNVPGVYAVGDATGRAPLTPVAIAAALPRLATVAAVVPIAALVMATCVMPVIAFSMVFGMPTVVTAMLLVVPMVFATVMTMVFLMVPVVVAIIRRIMFYAVVRHVIIVRARAVEDAVGRITIVIVGV